MKIFNTLTRTKEEFVPLKEGEVKLYACGPTVYNFIHIGNARPICIFDTLRRYFEYRGLKVTFAQNFTDIDDKIINRAKEEGKSSVEIAERFIKEYEIDAAGLGVRPATIKPKATDTMDTIIAMVKTLVDKGFAYEKNGDVYFRSKKFEFYGKLSHQPLDDLDAGNRIELSGLKEDALDFVLWKSKKPGEPCWDSPWGEGRPGWHIECSAIVKQFLGETIDIHGGGQDLIFPHHENEIAQSECANGAPYANYWMHNGYINVDNRKMSKSLGNFFTVRDVAEKYGYEPIKLMMLSAHYRSPISYSLEIIEQNKTALERLYTAREFLDFATKNAIGEAGKEETDFYSLIDGRKEQFCNAMDDDLNTADALAALFDFARDVNTFFQSPKPKEASDKAIILFDEFCSVLGILYNRNQQTVSDEIEALIEQREAARKSKDFKKADEIRDLLTSRGIILKDTAQGVQYSFVKES